MLNPILPIYHFPLLIAGPEGHQVNYHNDAVFWNFVQDHKNLEIGYRTIPLMTLKILNWYKLV